MGCATREPPVGLWPKVVAFRMLNLSFIRDDEEPSEVSWEERLARAYESKLFKEFALVSPTLKRPR